MGQVGREQAIAGVCLGLLPLTKLTWIIAFGLWPAIWCVWTVPIHLTQTGKRSLPLPPFWQLAAILLLGLYTLNLGYLFDGTFRPLGKYVFIGPLFRGRRESLDPGGHVARNRFAGTWLGAVPVPLPADFVQGIDTQRLDFRAGYAFLPPRPMGRARVVVLLPLRTGDQEPLGTWCLVALAVGVTVAGVWKRRLSPPAPLPEGEGASCPHRLSRFQRATRASRRHQPHPWKRLRREAAQRITACPSPEARGG